MTDPLTPTTKAGRALLYGMDRLMPEKHDDAVAKIIAIEQEARPDTAALDEVRRAITASGDEVICHHATLAEHDAAIAREYAIKENR